MSRIMDDAFSKLIAAFATSYESPQMRPLWLSAWADFSPAVILRTVEFVIRTYASFPSLDEFLEEATGEAVKVNRAYMRERMIECTTCDMGMVEVKDNFFRPCIDCLPDAHERWARGMYEPTQ